MKNCRFLIRAIVFGFAVQLLFCTCSNPKPTSTETIPVEYEYTAFNDITVIDGKGNLPKANCVVVIKDGLIYDVADANNYQLPERTQVIEAKGKYLMPGLIDMHAHVTVLPMDSNKQLMDHYDQEASFASLKTLLAFGITTVRNPAAPTADGVELKNLVKNGTALGPEIFTSGAALNRTKAWFGPFVATPSEETVRQEVRAQVEAGVDMIKVYSSLSPKLIEAAINEAHLLGVQVVGHLQNTSWTTGAQLGIDGISHAAPWTLSYIPEGVRHPEIDFRPMMQRIHWLENADYDSQEFQDMFTALKDGGVCIDPTLIAFHTKFWGNDSMYWHSADLELAHPLIRDVWNTATFTDSWLEEDFVKAQAQWKKLLKLSFLLYENGVMLTTGSDFPNPWVLPGKSLHQEMKLLNDAGIPPLDILKMATFNGAHFLGIENRKGSIEKGKTADLLILLKDPTINIENTQSIETVYLNGKPYSPSELLPD